VDQSIGQTSALAPPAAGAHVVTIDIAGPKNAGITSNATPVD